MAWSIASHVNMTYAPIALRTSQKKWLKKWKQCIVHFVQKRDSWRKTPKDTITVNAASKLSAWIASNMMIWTEEESLPIMMVQGTKDSSKRARDMAQEDGLLLD